jgi:hypothetical protein
MAVIVITLVTPKVAAKHELYSSTIQPLASETILK